MRKVPSKYIVRQDDYLIKGTKYIFVPALLVAIAITFYEYKIGGNLFDYHSLKLYGVFISSAFIILYGLLKIFLIPHKNKVEIIVDEDGLYLDIVDMPKPKPKKLLWEDIEDIQFVKWKAIIEILLISGKKVSFNYNTLGINLYKFRRTVRYFSGRDDYLKKNYVFLWLKY